MSSSFAGLQLVAALCDPLRGAAPHAACMPTARILLWLQRNTLAATPPAAAELLAQLVAAGLLLPTSPGAEEGGSAMTPASQAARRSSALIPVKTPKNLAAHYAAAPAIHDFISPAAPLMQTSALDILGRMDGVSDRDVRVTVTPTHLLLSAAGSAVAAASPSQTVSIPLAAMESSLCATVNLIAFRASKSASPTAVSSTEAELPRWALQTAQAQELHTTILGAIKDMKASARRVARATMPQIFSTEPVEIPRRTSALADTIVASATTPCPAPQPTSPARRPLPPKPVHTPPPVKVPMFVSPYNVTTLPPLGESSDEPEDPHRARLRFRPPPGDPAVLYDNKPAGQLASGSSSSSASSSTGYGAWASANTIHSHYGAASTAEAADDAKENAATATTRAAAAYGTSSSAGYASLQPRNAPIPAAATTTTKVEPAPAASQEEDAPDDNESSRRSSRGSPRLSNAVRHRPRNARQSSIKVVPPLPPSSPLSPSAPLASLAIEDASAGAAGKKTKSGGIFGGMF